MNRTLIKIIKKSQTIQSGQEQRLYNKWKFLLPRDLNDSYDHIN